MDNKPTWLLTVAVVVTMYYCHFLEEYRHRYIFRPSSEIVYRFGAARAKFRVGPWFVSLENYLTSKIQRMPFLDAKESLLVV